MAETPSGFRERATQLFSWLMGPLMHQRQHHVVQTERQLADGVTRGIEDPDNRRRQQMPQDAVASRPTGLTPADLLAARRDAARHVAERGGAATEDHGLTVGQMLQFASRLHQSRSTETPDSLTAQIETFQRHLQAQQQRQPGQGRGQGMGR